MPRPRNSRSAIAKQKRKYRAILHKIRTNDFEDLDLDSLSDIFCDVKTKGIAKRYLKKREIKAIEIVLKQKGICAVIDPPETGAKPPMPTVKPPKKVKRSLKKWNSQRDFHITK